MKSHHAGYYRLQGKQKRIDVRELGRKYVTGERRFYQAHLTTEGLEEPGIEVFRLDFHLGYDNRDNHVVITKEDGSTMGAVSNFGEIEINEPEFLDTIVVSYNKPLVSEFIIVSA
jgi:hypothetical protein